MKILIAISVLILSVFFFFQNCSKSQMTSQASNQTSMNILNEQPTPEELPQNIEVLPEIDLQKIKGLNWSVSNGSVNPENQYQINYAFNLETKKMNVIVKKGTAVKNLPENFEALISKEHVASIKLLVESIKFGRCIDDRNQIGGGINAVSLFYDVSASAHLILHQNQCLPKSAKNAKVESGFSELSAYILKLVTEYQPPLYINKFPLNSLAWATSSVPLPNYNYSVEYIVNFNNGQLQIKVQKGQLVTQALPNEKTKILSSKELDQVYSNYNKMKYTNCSGNAAIGGGADYIVADIKSSPMKTIFKDKCFVEKNQFQSASGYSELIEYLKEL